MTSVFVLEHIDLYEDHDSGVYGVFSTIEKAIDFLEVNRESYLSKDIDLKWEEPKIDCDGLIFVRGEEYFKKDGELHDMSYYLITEHKVDNVY
jgi:hypothetical protein